MQRFSRHAAFLVALLLVTATLLLSMGRVTWCACGAWVPWSFDVWSSHNSQHLVDPYTLSHVLHGVVFYGLLRALPAPHRERVGLLAAAGLEALWEIVENSPYIIERYRENTASLDYTGDSIANSMADILACVGGYLLAAALPVWGSVLFFLGAELLMVVWIRDSLLLNVLMLLYPVSAIRDWQMGT